MSDKQTEFKETEDATRYQSWFNGLAAMSNDSMTKTLTVALLVALFGSVMVTSASVLLQPRIDENFERERQKNLLEIVRRLPGSEKLFQRIGDTALEEVVVELSSGTITRNITPDQVGSHAAAKAPVDSIVIPPDRDIAGVKRVSRYKVVFLVREEDEIRLIVLPVHGQGYASTLRGYLGLAGDGNTIIGLNFYKHAETPGLGAQVDNPQWRNQWQGKKVRDPAGRLRIGVAIRAARTSDQNASYQVDGLTGATLTSRGVHNLIRFWLGDDGFGPFLNRIKSQ